MKDAYAILDKQERTAAVAAAKQAIIESLSEEQQEDANLGSALKKLESSVLRGSVVKDGKRIDGRALDKVRDIVCEPAYCRGPTGRPCLPVARPKVLS